MTDDAHIIKDEQALIALYGHGSPAALAKEVPYVHPHYRRFIEASSFVLIASSGPNGLDCSPRGDPAGFVRILDDTTLVIPDRRGNNRVDTLHNIVRDPRVGLLFLIPGVGESLRVNGRAVVSVAPHLLEMTAAGDKAPRSVIIVTVESAYFHCPRAAMRSNLWNPSNFVERSKLPSVGTIMTDLSAGRIDGAEIDKTRTEVLLSTLY